MEPGCTPHMGAHIGPIRVLYRLLAGSFVKNIFVGFNFNYFFLYHT